MPGVSAIIALQHSHRPQPARAVCETASGSTAVHAREQQLQTQLTDLQKQLEEVKKERDIYKGMW